MKLRKDLPDDQMARFDLQYELIREEETHKEILRENDLGEFAEVGDGKSTKHYKENDIFP